jgi:hypothetical protein
MRDGQRRVRVLSGWSTCALASTLWLWPAVAGAVDPTPEEQLFVYEVNRARSDPPGWATEMGIDTEIGGDGNPTDLMDVDPQPPLALNETLVDSSRFKAEEMAANNYFAHQSQVTQKWPNLIVREAGYPLPMMIPALSGGFFSLPDDSNQVESLAAGFGPPGSESDLSDPINAIKGLIIDEMVPNLGHRIHLLAMNEFSQSFREAAAGYGFNQSAMFRNYWAFHTGIVDTDDMFLTGVVFDDTNGNSLYDIGEGLEGVTVAVSSTPVTTNGAGGWSLLVGPGMHSVSCSGGGFAGSTAVDVEVADQNREVDCISGMAGAYVDFVLVPEPGAAMAPLAVLAALAGLARQRRRVKPRSA